MVILLVLFAIVVVAFIVVAYMYKTKNRQNNYKLQLPNVSFRDFFSNTGRNFTRHGDREGLVEEVDDDTSGGGSIVNKTF